jgi:hypothetical protein
MKSFDDQGVDSGADVDTAAAGGLAAGTFSANIQSFLFRQFGYGCSCLDKISIPRGIHVGPHQVGNSNIIRACGHTGATVLAEQSTPHGCG